MSFIRAYLRYLDDATWLPDGFKVASAMMSLCTIVDRKAYVHYSTTDYYPNHYCLLVGESNSGKGVAIKCAKRLIRKVAPELVFQDRFTPEGLLHGLSEMDVAHTTVFNDEMETIISGKQYMGGLTTSLLDLYDSQEECHLRYAKEEFDIREPYLNLFLGIQPDILGRVLTNAEVSSGFLPRVATFFCDAIPRRKALNGLPYLDVSVGVMRLLRQAFNRVDKPIRVNISEEAVDQIFDYTDAIKKQYADNKCFARFSDLLFKTSLVYYIDDVLSQCIPVYDVSLSTLSRRLRRHAVNAVNGVTASTVSTVSTNRVYKPPTENTVSPFDHTGGDSVTPLTPLTPFTLPTQIHEDFLPLLCEGEVSIRHVNMAIDTFDLKAIDRVSNIVSENTDTQTLQRLRDVITRIVDKGMAVESDGGRVFIPQRELLRYSRMTVHRMKPFVSTLQVEGMIGPLIMHCEDGRPDHRRPVFEYLLKKEE